MLNSAKTVHRGHGALWLSRSGPVSWWGTAIVLTIALGLVLGALALWGPDRAAADPVRYDHFAGDYFIFSKGGSGQETEGLECNPSNDKQVDISGNHLYIFGRIHSNADVVVSGQNNTFVDTLSPNPEITYGDGDIPLCNLQWELDNEYLNDSPYDISGNGITSDVNGPYQVNVDGWPGTLGSFLTQSGDDAFLTFTDPGIVCTVGTLEDTSEGNSDLVIDPTVHYNAVVCRNTGKISLNISNVGTEENPFKVTMISHGPIEISGQYLVMEPADSGHGVLAWTDIDSAETDVGIKLSGSNIDVLKRAILFTPRTGQDISGASDATLCLQVIGQGPSKVATNNAEFGPLNPLCGVPADVVTEIHGREGHTGDLQGGAVEVGTEFHDQVEVSSNSGYDLIGTITLNQFDNGTCSGGAAATLTYTATGGPAPNYAPALIVTLDSLLAFAPPVGVYSYQATYNGDMDNTATVGACEGPVHVVDADIQIDPPTGTNEVGTPHTLSGHVNVNPGTGLVNAPEGTTITFNKVSGVGSLSAPSCLTVGATGSCSVDLTSSTAGTTVVSASTTVTVLGVDLGRATDGVSPNSGNANKTWVDASIAIAPDGINKVGDPHTFTVHMEKDPGTGPVAAAGVVPTITFLGGPPAMVDTSDCDAGTDTGGDCDVVINSAVAGSFTAHAAADIDVGGLTVHRETDGNGNNSGVATKTYVDANIQISPATGTNEVGTPHTLTGHVNVNPGTGFVNAPAGTTINFNIENGVGSLTAASCLTIDATGSCTVDLNSSTAGMTVVSATTTVTVSDVVFGRSTDGVAPNSGNANKTWVDASIQISPLTGTNKINTDHQLTGHVNVNPGTGFVNAPADTTINFNIESGPGTLSAASCLTEGGTGSCSVTLTSSTAGTTEISATTTVTVSGLDLNRTTDGVSPNSGNAIMEWVSFRLIVITCNEMDDSLVASAVDLDGNLHTASDQTTTIGAMPSLSGLSQGDLMAYICNLGGASYGGLLSGPKTPHVDVNNPPGP